MKCNRRFNKICAFRILIVLTFISTLLIMKKIEPTFLVYSKGKKMLDMQFGYNSIDVYQLFKTLKRKGRLIYIKSLYVDCIFTISYIFVQNYILKFAMGKTILGTRWRILLSTAYLRGLFDIMENIFILTLLYKYKIKLPILVTMASCITIFKFIFLGIWVISIPLVLIVRLMMKKNAVEKI
ncbi:hypothetical protein [Inconstantimicrobium mannanitabidum]|uniref:hypothetical protein n=1 Tax=Inconstantimicrobium mannanitabidum TaxID=1604901 RepID=UPI0021C41CF3|nr:hypothetical protein [Clostridium sp. TW13]